MASITSWMRLEPRSRDAEMRTTLQARVYDPLWLLARQWQLGEFQGEDNGSPVMARWRAESALLTRYYAGAIKPNTMVSAPRYDSRLPLETLVERETTNPAVELMTQQQKLRFAVEAGQQFLRILQQQSMSHDYRDTFIRHYAFPVLTTEQRIALDGDSLGFYDVMTTRVPDGRQLYDAFRSIGAGAIKFPAELQIAHNDEGAVERVIRLWLPWLQTLFSEPDADNSAWVADRLEYAFSVGTRLSDAEQILTAQEYTDGHLDWYAFDRNLEVTLGGAADTATTEITRTIIPAPVSFRGMAAARFWEFEDAQVDFGAVDAGPTDLARMLLVEFALSYGNDWFVIPIELDVGSLCRTRSLVITDTFGVRTLIRPSGERDMPHPEWRMFQLSQLPIDMDLKPEPNLFFLPPSIIKSLESRPLEEVLFLRDEMANLAWGVERLVESATERPLNRYEAYLQERQQREAKKPPPPVIPPGTLRYQLETEVPDYWIPLIPARIGQELRLRRGAVLKFDGKTEIVPARGRILMSKPGPDLALYEEEVPREGVRVTRSYQFTRWIDGSTHLWIGRHKGVGHGEGSSGLQFDIIET